MANVAIVTLIERKSGFAVLAKVTNKSADLVGRAIERKLKPLGSRVKTLTVDNGKEFADHQVDRIQGVDDAIDIGIHPGQGLEPLEAKRHGGARHLIDCLSSLAHAKRTEPSGARRPELG